jgi:hypothetical protein
MQLKKMLVLGVVSAAAAFAVASPSAMAAAPADTVASHWTGVTITNPGSFTATSNHVLLNGTALDCKVTLNATINASGHVEVTGGSVTAGDFLCGAVTLNGLSWGDGTPDPVANSQVCEHVADASGPLSPHVYVLYLPVHFTALGLAINGTINGPVGTAPSGSPVSSTGVSIPLQNINATSTLRADGGGGSLPFTFSKTITGSSNTNACSWTQLI